ncbi:hypothetical protein QM012_005561 [Aureobasidium pullulans]|uniref:RNI-like protein n=1 Tax=Aureobasidium pullulans TaxID=5580 RepID=A0ABR0T4I8_AURPU
MATPATATLSGANRPGWGDLPAEIHEQVVNHLFDQRATLEALITADCPATGEALRLYWKTATPDNDLFTLLESKPLHHRQFFANMLRQITINFKALDEHHEGRGLQYPRLQSLTVVHDKALMGTEELTHARIRRFIGPRLRTLEVGCQLHEGMNLKPTTHNFLPALSGCVDLRRLTIRARVRGAAPGDLIRVLSNCTNLSSLDLELHSERLVDEHTIRAIAIHPVIRFLEIDKHLNLPLVSLIAKISQPFQHIISLRLCIDANAASSLLPHMKKLEMLELTVFNNYGTPSIFPFLHTLTTLKSLYLKFHNHILKECDSTHLVPLKRLKMLELADYDEGEFFDTTLVRGEFLAAMLGSLPFLESFTLHASSTFGDAFLIALGRNCLVLRTLTLDGRFTLEPLSRERCVLFPALEVLELGHVDSSMPLREWGGYREAWAGGVGRSLVRHAPKLQQLWLQENGGGGLGELVRETWEEMIGDREGLGGV